MTQFHEQINSRISEVHRSLGDAHEAGDDYLVDVHLGELESLARIAADHGVEVPGVRESIERFGGTSPSGIDLTRIHDAAGSA